MGDSKRRELRAGSKPGRREALRWQPVLLVRAVYEAPVELV